MKFLLILDVENNKKRKELRWSCVPEIDVLTELTTELINIWPGEKLPSIGSLLFRYTDKGLQLNCKKSLTINGVAVKSRILKPGDRIIYGPLRLFFREAHIEYDPPLETEPPENRHKDNNFKKLFRPLPAALISIVLGAAIIASCVVVPKISTDDELSYKPNVQMTSTAVEHKAPKEPIEDKPAADPLQTTALHSKVATQPAIPETKSEKEQGDDSLIIIAPGERIPSIDLDILFIHAHPDDEALDFGCLMALAEASGLKTGLVTFTDGESGLDTYPERPVSGLYPNHYMEKNELSTVRSEELAESAETLGIDILIRLGLKNNPYNSIRDELSSDEIFKVWGGKNSISEKLFEIIEKTVPETIAAPDIPARYREHFEHEAVGVISAEMFNKIKTDSRFTPERFITCIDPRNNKLYPEAMRINANLKTKDNKSLRDIQLSALSMHKTQNDAVNVGMDFLPEYPYEYYKIQYQQEHQNWDEWISELSR